MLNTLTGYFDDAGGADHGFTVVSGWLSTILKWRQFDTDWKLLLAHYDLPYFSMKECAQFHGVFGKWRTCLGTRDNFLRDAAGIIKSSVLHGFGAIVLHDEFDDANRQYALREYVGSPYALAGQLCVKHSLGWGRDNGYVGWGMAFVFDQGTPKWGTLKTLMKREGLADPMFCSPRDSHRAGELAKGQTPLQAADFLAYELRKIKRDDPDELWPISKYRKSIRALVSVPSYWGQCKKSDLEWLCHNHSHIKTRRAA